MRVNKIKHVQELYVEDGWQLATADTASGDGFQPRETAFDLDHGIQHATRDNSTAQEVKDLIATLEKQEQQKREQDDTVQRRKEDGRAFGHKRGHKVDAKSEDAADKSDSES
ncbi:hypothetical protein QFC24_003387 [Naganishia onofrii]|uniref:Uncharacterized protein n=1 Tax=Naganishia onofrii TaxID=1851511 RepID=A0ACC2XMC2_9TREE|nr:hypothetical protein QFC24_003387 [Naganishia onofrii]